MIFPDYIEAVAFLQEEVGNEVIAKEVQRTSEDLKRTFPIFLISILFETGNMTVTFKTVGNTVLIVQSHPNIIKVQNGPELNDMRVALETMNILLHDRQIKAVLEVHRNLLIHGALDIGTIETIKNKYKL